MEQTASTALIAAIVAVVLGALGLVGGVIGYVQGTAALRRATLIRQRAAAAEEAALQARTQAEQAARTAQSVLDRLSGLRGVGDLADLPTGPLVLPSRVAPTPTGELAVPIADPEPAPESRFARPVTAPTPVSDAVVEPVAVAPEPEPEPEFVEPEPQPVAVEPETEPEPNPASAEPVTGPAAVSFFIDGPTTGATQAPPTTGPTALPPISEPIEPQAPATGPASVVEPSVVEPEGVQAPPERSATGQVNARGQQVSMDWAEALRTGAIPLPSRSRRSYAAPSKAAGQPIGPPRFEIRAVGRQKWEAVNIGGTTAEQASVEGAADDSHLVRPVEPRPKPVEPGGSLAFSVLRVEGRKVSVHLTWMAGGDEDQAILPLP